MITFYCLINVVKFQFLKIKLIRAFCMMANVI